MESEKDSQYPYNYNKGNGTYFGPEDELPPEDLEKCKVAAEKYLLDTDAYNKELNLMADDEIFRAPNQNIALVSFIGPYEFLKVKHEKFQICFRGASNTPETTIARLKQIQTSPDGSKYDIYTIGMYEWVAMPPNIKFMKNNDLHEEFLNGVIVRHRREMALRKELFEARKKKINKYQPTKHESSDSESESEEEEEEVPNIGTLEIPQIVNEIAPLSPRSMLAPLDNIQEKLGGLGEFDPMEKVDQGFVESQKWSVFSLVGNLADGMAIKIHGFYETEEMARNIVDNMKQVDDTFDTYIAEAYRWLPLDSDLENIDHVYQNEQLNKLYKTHKDESQKAQFYNKNQIVKGKIPNVPQLVNESGEESGGIEIEILNEEEGVSASNVYESL